MSDHLRRFIGEPPFQQVLDKFFGSEDWRRFVDLRASGEKVTYGALLEYYEGRLKSIGFRHVDHDIGILRSNERALYHLVFATKDDKGLEFFQKISKRRFSGQHRML